MRGRGYVEFLAWREEILAMIDEGYHFSQIHRMLFEQGKISTKYKNFYQILRRAGIQKRKLKQLKYGPEVLHELSSSIQPDTETSCKDSESQNSSQREDSDNATVFFENDPTKQERHW